MLIERKIVSSKSRLFTRQGHLSQFSTTQVSKWQIEYWLTRQWSDLRPITIILYENNAWSIFTSPGTCCAPGGRSEHQREEVHTWEYSCSVLRYILVQIYMKINTTNTKIYTNQYSKYEYIFAITYMHFAGAYVFFLFLSRAFLVIWAMIAAICNLFHFISFLLPRPTTQNFEGYVEFFLAMVAQRGHKWPKLAQTV